VEELKHCLKVQKMRQMRQDGDEMVDKRNTRVELRAVEKEVEYLRGENLRLTEQVQI